jgi:hypothetical protein
VLNYGGPAREVSVWGVVGAFGFGGYTEPSTYWQPGERRTFRLHVPPIAGESQIMVVGRDMAKRQLFAATYGGATCRWRIWKLRTLSTGDIWRRLFPETPEARHGPMRVEVIERDVAGRLSTSPGRAVSAGP